MRRKVCHEYITSGDNKERAVDKEFKFVENVTSNMDQTIIKGYLFLMFLIWVIIVLGVFLMHFLDAFGTLLAREFAFNRETRKEGDKSCKKLELDLATDENFTRSWKL